MTSGSLAKRSSCAPSADLRRQQLLVDAEPARLRVEELQEGRHVLVHHPEGREAAVEAQLGRLGNRELPPLALVPASPDKAARLARVRLRASMVRSVRVTVGCLSGDMAQASTCARAIALMRMTMIGYRCRDSHQRA